MLAYYAEQLPSVELNNTFYRMPKQDVLEGWHSQVPPGFRFAVKASRRITHIKRLKEPVTELEFLYRNLHVLGDRLGIVLFQLPPTLRKDIPRLRRFLEPLPADAKAAFEFRHESWWDDETYAALRERGLALCVSDEGAGEDRPPLALGHYGYLRLRRPAYPDQELARWVTAMRDAGWTDVFVYFKHEDEGAAPAMARRLLDLTT
jgi:uncharacterized protein YecE (DUF72 family)